MPDLFVHPLTGELLEADEDSLQAAVTAAGKEIGRLARARDVLLGPLADIRGPVELPPPRWRTPTQQKVCPKCRREQVVD